MSWIETFRDRDVYVVCGVLILLFPAVTIACGLLFVHPPAPPPQDPPADLGPGAYGGWDQ